MKINVKQLTKLIATFKWFGKLKLAESFLYVLMIALCSATQSSPTLIYILFTISLLLLINIVTAFFTTNLSAKTKIDTFKFIFYLNILQCLLATALFLYSAPLLSQLPLTLLLFDAIVLIKIGYIFYCYYMKHDGCYYMPENEAEIIALIKEANQNGLKIRVTGSSHSTPEHGIHSDNFKGIDVRLDNYNKIIAYNDDSLEITVQAGCLIGYDPENIFSTPQNNIIAFLQEKGWALPILGGIYKQSISGFFATDSSGGSLTHSLSKYIIEIRLLDGTGKIQILKANTLDENNPFYSVLGSVGLLGIISTITLKCCANYALEGKEETLLLPHNQFDIRQEAKRLVQESMQYEYSRVFITYMTNAFLFTSSICNRTYLPNAHDFPAFEHPLNSKAAQFSIKYACGILNLLKKFNLRVAWLFEPIYAMVNKQSLINFYGDWTSLAFDNCIYRKFLDFDFLELYFDIKDLDNVIDTLITYLAYNKAGQVKNFFPCEVYFAPASEFWLSPAYKRASIRLSFWALRSTSFQNKAYFNEICEAFKLLNYRLHKGKYFPPSAFTNEDNTSISRQEKNSFSAIRKQYDPKNIFINSYWKAFYQIDE